MKPDLIMQAAIALLAHLPNRPVVIAVTTSNQALESALPVKELAEAISARKIPAAVFSMPERTAQNPAQALSQIAAAENPGVLLLSLPAVCESETAMCYAAACDGAVLYEKKRSSRTDAIASAVDTLRALDCDPLGFILE